MALNTKRKPASRYYKIKTLKELAPIIEQLKKRGKKIVLCSGVFDFIHPGHIDYLERSRRLGDILVVSIVNDRFVTKGPSRPLFKENIRLAWLAALEAVDYVVLNNDYGPTEIMLAIEPEIFVKGAEDKPKLKDPFSGISENKMVMDFVGGRVKFVKDIIHAEDIFGEIYRYVNNVKKSKKK